MLFNTLQFAIFFLIVYGLYLILDHKWQNRMLLAASCIFYAAWDWRFLFLIFTSIATDYFCSLKIDEANHEKTRRLFLLLSIFINLSILGFFKYFNFFLDNLRFLLGHFGIIIPLPLLKIILPVGISFYTFQTMSYTFDVYRKELKPTKNILNYALFVSYFPQLVAGPIMRAKDLLLQIFSPRKVTLSKFYEGCYLILWGLFQKIFVADNLAKIVDSVFTASLPYVGSKVLIALYAFAFQIYCDFAGYSNIARGLGKCMGFEIMINFNLPYFSTNPRDFWKRWHISLSTWFRDYVYIPLGGNKKGLFTTYRNLAITMLLAGLWHGASWTFVLWGAYHGTILIIYRLFEPLLKRIPTPKNIFIGKIWFFIRAVFFFHLVCVGWLLFRSQSMIQVYDMLKSLIFNFHFVIRGIGLKTFLGYIWLLLLIQYICFRKNNLYALFELPVWIRSLIYVLIYFSLTIHGVTSGQEFIYFQF